MQQQTIQIPQFKESELNEIKRNLLIPRYIKRNKIRLVNTIIFAKIFSYSYQDLLTSMSFIEDNHTKYILGEFLNNFSHLGDMNSLVRELEFNTILKYELHVRITTKINMNYTLMMELIKFYIYNFVKKEQISGDLLEFG